MRKIFLTLIAIAVVAYLILMLMSSSDHSLGEVRIKDQVFAVEFAVTPEEQSRGLGSRDALPENRGMLFFFEEKKRYPFWMKGMRFPLDIIWIDEGRIIAINKNLTPDDREFPDLYYPPAPINTVFEVNAGISDLYGFEIGDEVTIQFPK